MCCRYFGPLLVCNVVLTAILIICQKRPPQVDTLSTKDRTCRGPGARITPYDIRTIQKHLGACNHTARLKPGTSDILRRRTHWQLIYENGKENLFYSAYFDARDEVGTQPVLRIFGVASGKMPLFCQVWYSGFDKPYVALTEYQVNGYLSYTFNGTRYERLLYTCRLKMAYPRPTHVSLASAPCKRSTVLLPIVVAEPGPWQMEFGICLGSIVFGKVDPFRFVEWVEINRMFGVREVWLYKSTAIEDEEKFDRILNYYVKIGVLRVTDLLPPVHKDSEDAMYLAAIAALNDCMYRNMYRFKFLSAGLDFDENLIPRMDDNFHDLLARVDKAKMVNSTVNGYIFPNAYFFKASKQDTKEDGKYTSLRFRHRQEPDYFTINPKTIINPRKCVSAFTHYCYVPFAGKRLEGYVDVAPSLALKHHYRECNLSPDKCAKKPVLDDTMLKYKDSLIRRTEIVFKSTGLS